MTTGNKPQLGLRERKKLLTRRAILEAADAMFAKRGYDNVTVAEIADAVNIAAKTVFVYFPNKEDLVFHGEDEMRDKIIVHIRGRASNESALDAMAAFLRTEIVRSGRRSVDELARLRQVVGDSPVLQARMRLMWEKFETALADLLADETGAARDAPEPRVAAAQIMLIYRLLASDDVLAHIRSYPKTKQRAAYTEWLDVSLRLVGAGIGDYGRRSA